MVTEQTTNYARGITYTHLIYKFDGLSCPFFWREGNNIYKYPLSAVSSYSWL